MGGSPGLETFNRKHLRMTCHLTESRQFTSVAQVIPLVQGIMALPGQSSRDCLNRFNERGFLAKIVFSWQLWARERVFTATAL